MEMLHFGAFSYIKFVNNVFCTVTDRELTVSKFFPTMMGEHSPTWLRG